jgi:predicted lipid-binding transport protein (Tim44 family)
MRLLALLLVFAVAACAEPRPAPTAASQVATPQTAAAQATARPKPAGVTSNREAVAEIKATRQAYEEAQKAFATGDKAKALELMNGAYLDHFERVEAWMDQVLGKEYREKVESAISRDLRRKLRDKTGTDAEIAAQFPVALQMLAEAETKLPS